jgi:hypothetical protein
MTLAVGGVAGLLLAAGRESGDDTTDSTESVPTIDPTVDPTIDPTIAATTVPVVAPTTSIDEPTANTTSTTSVVAGPQPVLRPIVDAAVCEPISATGGTPTGLPRDTWSALPLTLFAMRSELPVPIQVIGDPVDGQAKPFALLLRFRDRAQVNVSGASSASIASVDGIDVSVDVLDNGNGHASWTLPDGSSAYLRARGLNRAQVLAIVGRLAPRPVDAPIPGFDYDADGAPAGLELVAEGMNTDPRDSTYAGSQCRVASTGFVYRIGAFAGPPIFTYGAVIDRPVPVDVGVVGEAVVVISGVADALAPTVDDVVDADEAVWRELLLAPELGFEGTQPIGGATEVVAELVPIDDTTTPVSDLILRVEVNDDVASFVVDRRNAVVADAAEFWKVEIDGRIRSRTSAVPGSGMGVGGVHLIDVADAPLGYEFTARISTTDGDDQTIQTTGELRLILSLPPS